MQSTWQEKAVELALEGNSYRSIARMLNVPNSTCGDHLRKHFKALTSNDLSKGDGKVVAWPKKPQNAVKSHMIIADTQCKPGVDITYMSAIGEFAAEKQPDVIIHIGDHYDFESLSSYDKGKKSFEGRRLLADIQAGNDGFDALMKPIKELQDNQRSAGEKVYSPRLVFCEGNHENRFDRLGDNMPELDGFVGVQTLHIEKWGFEVIPFLKPVDIDGIFYVHYLANPFTGKPYGGTALNQLKTIGRSFVVGHKQTLDVAIRPTIDGKMQIGVINGACYEHDEAYKGYQGNNHFRGITVLHEVNDGFGIPMFVSLDYLQRKLKEKKNG
jgi:hypothetical protein